MGNKYKYNIRVRFASIRVYKKPLTSLAYSYKILKICYQ
jgi:hypothetical protein